MLSGIWREIEPMVGNALLLPTLLVSYFDRLFKDIVLVNIIDDLDVHLFIISFHFPFNSHQIYLSFIK